MISLSPISMLKEEYWTTSFLKAALRWSSFFSLCQLIFSASLKRSERGLSYSTRRTLMFSMFSW